MVNENRFLPVLYEKRFLPVLYENQTLFDRSSFAHHSLIIRSSFAHDDHSFIIRSSFAHHSLIIRSSFFLITLRVMKVVMMIDNDRRLFINSSEIQFKNAKIAFLKCKIHLFKITGKCHFSIGNAATFRLQYVPGQGHCPRFGA